MVVRSLVLSQYQRVTDKQTDRKTDMPPMPVSHSSVAEHNNADARYWYSNFVRPSVRLSRSGIVSKRLNVSSSYLELW